MLLFVQHMTPQSWIAGAANARNYLITQPYVALLYLKTFFWPSSLSADYDLNPFTTVNDPRFWAGFAFVVLFIAVAIAAVRFQENTRDRFRSALVSDRAVADFTLSTRRSDERSSHVSSIHRTRDRDGRRDSLLFESPDRQYTYRKSRVSLRSRAVLCGNGYATFQRNKVWKTEETLWHDVATKSPRNPRGLMNYGNTLMAKGDFAGALDYFHRAQQLTPQYSVLLINLAIAEDATKQSAAAEQHFKEALRLAPSIPDSYTYYARYLISHSRAEEARAFLRSALELSPTDLTARELLAQTDDQTSQ